MTTTEEDLRTKGWTEYAALGFMELVGPLWVRRTPELHVAFLPTEKHANRRGIVHGGVLATICDCALSMTARELRDDLGLVTISITVQFAAAAQVGQLLSAKCEILRRTRSLVFVRGDIFQPSGLVASASGVWKILRP